MSGRALMFFIVLLFAQPLRAEPARRVDLAAGAHVGQMSAGRVQWRSSYWANSVLDASASYDLDFAVPLPALADVRLDRDLDAVRLQIRRDPERRIVGVSVTGSRDLPTLVTTIQATESSFDPPFAVGVPQRVELSGARYVHSEGAVISHGLLDTRHSVTASEVRVIDRVQGEAQGRAIYLRPDEAFINSGGLSPYLVPDAEVRASAFLGLGGLFMSALLILLVGLRRAVRSARAEAAEAFLAEHEARLIDEFGAAG